VCGGHSCVEDRGAQHAKRTDAVGCRDGERVAYGVNSARCRDYEAVALAWSLISLFWRCTCTPYVGSAGGNARAAHPVVGAAVPHYGRPDREDRTMQLTVEFTDIYDGEENVRVETIDVRALRSGRPRIHVGCVKVDRYRGQSAPSRATRRWTYTRHMSSRWLEQSRA